MSTPGDTLGSREGQPIQRHSTLRRVREDLYSSIRTTFSSTSSGAPPPGINPLTPPPLTPGGLVSPPSALAFHLANTLPPSLGGNRQQLPLTSTPQGPVSWMSGASNWNPINSPPSLEDNIVSYQPAPLTPPNQSSVNQHVVSPLNQAHVVMDIELGQPQLNDGMGQSLPGHSPPAQPGPGLTNPPLGNINQGRGGVLPGGQTPGGGAGGGNNEPAEPESGWSQILNSNPELKAIVNACERYIPFCILVFIKSVFEHGLGIIVCLGLVLTFLHSNSVVKHQIGRQGRRNLGPLLAVTINLSICTVFIYYMFFDSKLSLSAFFIPPEEVCSVVDLLWITGINDFFLKFLSVFTKIVVTVSPAKFLPYQKRGKYYLFIEVTSQLHRQLAPIQPWLMYLLHAKGEGPSSIPYKLLGVFLTAAYMVVKGKSLVKALELWRVALHKLMSSTRYGKSPTSDEMKSGNGFCPICQDNYQEPTMLQCKHIFCEECVSTWFDRDTTCPMCRAKISEDPAWRDGSTSQFIQLF